jgi:hypothetical protein
VQAAVLNILTKTLGNSNEGLMPASVGNSGLTFTMPGGQNGGFSGPVGAAGTKADFDGPVGATVPTGNKDAILFIPIGRNTVQAGGLTTCINSGVALPNHVGVDLTICVGN